MYIADRAVASGGFGLAFDVRDMCPAGFYYAGDLTCQPVVQTSGNVPPRIYPSGISETINVEACTTAEIKIPFAGKNYCVPYLVLGLIGAIGLVLVIR